MLDHCGMHCARESQFLFYTSSIQQVPNIQNSIDSSGDTVSQVILYSHTNNETDVRQAQTCESHAFSYKDPHGTSL